MIVCLRFAFLSTVGGLFVVVGSTVRSACSTGGSAAPVAVSAITSFGVFVAVWCGVGFESARGSVGVI